MSIGNSPEDERPIADVSPAVPDEADDAPREPGPSVGRALQQARIAAGLTVDDISTATRVRIAIVHAIEADDFAPCGGDVYARGHIRTLAKAVGLDPAELVAQFDADHGGRPAPTPAAPLFEAERIRPERRGPNWTAAMVAAIVAVIGFVGFSFVKGGDDGGNEASVAEGAQPSAGESASASAKPKKPADPKPEPSDSAIAAAPRDKVTVKVTAADGRSWISAQDHNGRLLFDDILERGDSKTFQDSEKVKLVLGDAGAIELYVNGKKIEDDFQPGAVERLTYTKGDPQVG
ncbi:MULTISPECIES: helix-turn-helix domain-containing protein [Streptomyces]|uniref:Helix-turn-helix domain-containing protein n=3 Tax=Streptomyces rochei group TaxID=2867164 RepID=A0AAX3ZNX9_STRRO|nr:MULTISPECIES: helix-turn-helix domain-containing protein [Streptomyces]WDI20942.1 helix-turn-helix domain-containing protein [Streptomyces enissocaesilis]GGY96093.1 membrane protein [Streptomyces geysiriensis]MBJ6621748.1 helix-turn-helix domain-containing protein [Streptomyces sp. DHE17-7]MBQ0879492.1 helix-turn-helix domain-containing protein [Streptomyces sp. RT42]MBQ0913000.1 helix-turn-helix domain-containing protein [Streptomyces sp. RM99]